MTFPHAELLPMALPFLLPLLLCAPALAQAKADAETRALIARVDAARGAARLPATLVIEGTYEVRFEGAPGGEPVAKGGFRELYAAEAARHSSDMGPFGKMERGFTKELVWETDPHMGAKRYDGAAAQTVRRWFALLRGDSPNGLYVEIARTGAEPLDGVEHVVLKMTPSRGKADTWYVDAQTGHVARIDIALPSPDSAAATWDMEETIDSQLRFGDWRAVDGVFHAHRRELRMGPATVASTCTKITAGGSIEAAALAPPEAVTKLKPKVSGRPIGDPAGATYEIEERQPQPVASIRVQCKPAEISATLAVLLPEVMAHLTATGARMTGPPFSRYHAFGDDSVDLEAGIPVAQPIAEKGRVKNGELPGGKVVTAVHFGPYEKLGAAHAALRKHLDQHELKSRGGPWEVYWTDPGMVPDSSKWRTQLFAPIE
jgi:effector-binding domain-containing protein